MDIFDKQIFDDHLYMIGYAMVKKNGCEILNYVSPTFRILRIVDGIVEWKVRDRLFVFQPGDVVLFNNLHRRNINRVLSGTVYYELYDFLPSCITMDKLRNFFYSDEQKVISHRNPEIKNSLLLLGALKDEILGDDPSFGKMCITHYLDLIALEFYKKFRSEDISSNHVIEALSKAIAYIQANLKNEIHMPDVAGSIGYSSEYFSRVFKKFMGITPSAYIINLRIENVLHLISTTDITIVDAAYKSGFQSSSAFYKSFKKYKQTTPTKLK